jgi:hypothetical protein
MVGRRAQLDTPRARTGKHQPGHDAGDPELPHTTPAHSSDGEHERGIQDPALRSYEVGDEDGGRNGELPLPGRPFDREHDRVEGKEADASPPNRFRSSPGRWRSNSVSVMRSSPSASHAVA